MILTDEEILQFDFDSCHSVSFKTNQIAFARAVERAVAAAVAKRCADLCDLQASEPECPERATYCADAIRREFGEVSNG